MQNEELIVNKIIPIEKIVEVANYFENQKDEYIKIKNSDEVRNRNVNFSEKIYEYNGEDPSIEYTLAFKDGRTVTKRDYNWFLVNLNNCNRINRIEIKYLMYFSRKEFSNSQIERKNEYLSIKFYENKVNIYMESKGLEELLDKNYSFILSILESCEDRYNKTIKGSKLRIQALSLSIGFVLSYFVYFALLAFKSNMNGMMANLVFNKYFLIIGQWLFAAVFGNVFGYPIMMGIYGNILPKAKYSHYSKSSHKSVYVTNVEDYLKNNEIQIGMFAGTINRRNLIEKIYKVTKIIVLIQCVISLLFFIFIK